MGEGQPPGCNAVAWRAALVAVCGVVLAVAMAGVALGGNPNTYETYEGDVGPHVDTVRWYHSVPEGKYHVVRFVQVCAIRTVAATTPGTALASIRFGEGARYTVVVIGNAVGDRHCESGYVGQGFGQYETVVGFTSDSSVGGSVRYQVLATIERMGDAGGVGTAAVTPSPLPTGVVSYFGTTDWSGASIANGLGVAFGVGVLFGLVALLVTTRGGR